MLLQEHFDKATTTGFLLGKEKVLHVISIDQDIIGEVKTIAKQIQDMLSRGYKPESSASFAQCSLCEYLNLCNDRF